MEMKEANAETIKQYVEDDLILEFDSAEEALNYFNTYDYQKFETVEEMKAYQGEYGFGFNGKWYHINYEYVMEEFKKVKGLERG
jgi:hypothetical protein